MTHPELVKALVKPGEVMLKELTPKQAELWHMVSCISSEAGELFDTIKKHCIYRKNLDLENVIEELGDIEFYLEGVRQLLYLTREQCLENNIKKLSKRYALLTYTNEQAQKRADKEV